MKKIFLLLLIVLGVGALVGELMVKDPGYILIAYNKTSIETSLWVGTLIIIIGFIILHGLINLITRSRLPLSSFQAWKERRSHQINRRKTLKGLTLLSQGNWAKAQKQLAQAAECSDLPFINYLEAARAAHEQNDEQAADDFLQKARKATPEAEITVAIAQAEIQFDRGQLEPCLATLLRLRTLAPGNTYVMKLLKDTYIRLQDWSELAALLPILKKRHALKEDDLQQLTQQCYCQLMNASIESVTNTSNSSKLKSLRRTWQNIPTEQIRNTELVQHYTQLLVSLGAGDNAEQNLRGLIKRNWDEKLVSLYGRVSGENVKKQLGYAQGWLKNHENSPALLLTLGRLSMQNQNWEQAISYFEKSLEVSPNTETLAELTRLLRHLGNNEKAQILLQNNLNLISNGLPELPIPEQLPQENQ